MDALDLNADGYADNVLLGDRISSWTDKITDKNATQSEWTKQPVKTANAVSFHEHALKITDLNVTAQHIFIVAKRRPRGGWEVLFDDGSGKNRVLWYNEDMIRDGHPDLFADGAGGSIRVSAGPNSLTDNVAFIATLTVNEDEEDDRKEKGSGDGFDD
jgi:hypothetical protein